MAIVLYARKSVERENSISCETQLEYCRSVIKPDERDEKVITFGRGRSRRSLSTSWTVSAVLCRIL